MHPISFNGANCNLTKPDNMTDEQCFSLSAEKDIDNNGFPYILTAWQPNKEDLEALIAGRPLFLKVIGNSHPPMGMFTVDEKYNKYHILKFDDKLYYQDLQEYQQAKERCLFESFEVVETENFNLKQPKSVCIFDLLHIYWWQLDTKIWNLSKGISTIEDLAKYNLQLTPTAIKQIGL